MSNESKFKHTLQQWELSERLRHQGKDQKSLVRKITYKIKKTRKEVASFFYINFLLHTKFKKTTPTISANNTAVAQTYTLGRHVNKCTLENKKVLAVVIHAFYFDIFTRIIEKTKSIGIPYALYITTHKAIAQEVSSHIKLLGLDAHIEVYENKGRDILPFLKIINLIKTNGHQVILKLHTKKSPHKFSKGRRWCDSMVDQLLDASVIDKVIENFTTYPTIGLIAPHRHLHLLRYKGGSNMPHITELADKIGYQGNINQQSFVGGTMFYARANAFDSLLKLNIKDTDFKEEPIPMDGTLAHVIERTFGLAANKEGLETVDTKFIKSLNKQSDNSHELIK
ncbi:rhamnan synthesis F family protein [Gammaproteobacteria bacterium]|nr:rhamnan synthesis F family protein [Gammaproteobacteria bacterium]